MTSSRLVVGESSGVSSLLQSLSSSLHAVEADESERAWTTEV